MATKVGLKKSFLCIVRRSYVSNLVKIGPQITLQRWWQMPDTRVGLRTRQVIFFCPMLLCIASGRQW